MKRILISLFVIAILLSGCNVNDNSSNKTGDPSNETGDPANNETDVLDQGQLEKQFEEDVLSALSERFSLTADEEKIYLLTLENLSKIYKRDISTYVNVQTGRPCDGQLSTVVYAVENVGGELQVITEVELVCPE